MLSRRFVPSLALVIAALLVVVPFGVPDRVAPAQAAATLTLTLTTRR
jgi:hypothetical protein